VRRIEATTGWEALDYLRERRTLVREMGAQLRTPERDLPRKVQEMAEQIKTLGREKKALEDKLVSSGGRDHLAQAENIGGIKVLCTRAEVSDVRALRNMMDDLRSKVDSGILCLAAQDGQKATLLLFVSKDLHGLFTAPDLVKEIAEEIGGSGGGRPDLAQAGGGNPEGIDRAFNRLKEVVARNSGGS
jgi:alanyl-tRNA synthetase